MTDTQIGAPLWLVTARLAGGEVPAGAGGAYASIIVAARSIEPALQAARDLCRRDRYHGVEITACRQLDPEDPEDGADAVIRERALWVARTGDPAIATLHTFPRDN
jgi:hypothetical protein